MKNDLGFDLREQEKVIKVVNHHLVVVVPHVIISFLILILNFFLMYYLFIQGWWGAVLFFAIVLSVIFYIVRLIFLYKMNRFVITNQRIIDFEQVGFFEKFINEFTYSKISKANAVMKGVGSAIFKYGNLKLILSEDLGPFELYKVPRPIVLQELINSQIAIPETLKTVDKCVDPVGLIMAEINMLSRSEKIKIYKKIKADLLAEKNKNEFQIQE